MRHENILISKLKNEISSEGQKNMKNMIEDVCELGSILQSGDEEKIALERKLVELDGAIQAQDRRLNHEVEAEDWARSEQTKILEHAENASDTFELSSSVISHLQEESTSSRHLQNLLLRVENYLNLKDGLVSGMEHTQMQIIGLQKAFIKLENIKADGIPIKTECTRELIKENETREENMVNILTDSQSYIEIRSKEIEENLRLGASNISSTFPHIEQSRILNEDKIRDLETKASVERSDADLTLSSLQSAKEVSLSHLSEVVHERDDILDQFNRTAEGILEDEALLKNAHEENKVLLNNSTCSSKAKYTTAREVDDAKKELIELEKESSDNRDELDRIKKALSFERLREEAFVKSQNGNAGSAQQICQETDNLRASLLIVREEIALIKQQIEPRMSGAILPWGQIPELISDTPNEELDYLTASHQYHQDQRDKIAADVNASIAEKDILDREFQDAEIHRAAAGEEKANLQEIEQALQAEQKDIMEKIQATASEIQANLPDLDSASSFLDSMNPEIKTRLLRDLEEVEASRTSAYEHSTILRASAACHAEKVETFNIQKESRYELPDKSQRLKMSRQEKVIDTERLLKEIQRELTREDGKFQEAYKLAVGAAKKKEEELLAVMNNVSLVGLKFISDRENARLEVKELEDSLRLMDQEYAEQLHLLSASAVDISMSMEGCQVPPPLRWASNQAGAPAAKTGNNRTVRSTSVENLTKGERGEKETPPASNWGSSSPATHLPEQSSSLEDDKRLSDAATTIAMLPTTTGNMQQSSTGNTQQSKVNTELQQHDGGSKKTTLGRKKPLGAPMTATNKVDTADPKSSAVCHTNKDQQPVAKKRAEGSTTAVDREKGAKAITGNERHRRSH